MEIKAEGIESDILEKCYRQTTGIKDNFMVHPYGHIMGRNYLKFNDRIRGFEVHSNDVWVCTYPKSGI